jgi:hypothetical protein
MRRAGQGGSRARDRIGAGLAAVDSIRQVRVCDNELAVVLWCGYVCMYACMHAELSTDLNPNTK